MRCLLNYLYIDMECNHLLLPVHAGSAALGAAVRIRGDADMVIWSALQLLLTPQVLLVMAASALYGLVVGAIPGFSAAMAVAPDGHFDTLSLANGAH